MSTTIQYKGNTLATVSNDTKTLKTAGKYMEGDVSITDNSGSGQGTVWQDAEGYIHLSEDGDAVSTLKSETVTPNEYIQVITKDTEIRTLSYTLSPRNNNANTTSGVSIYLNPATDLTDNNEYKVVGRINVIDSGYNILEYYDVDTTITWNNNAQRFVDNDSTAYFDFFMIGKTSTARATVNYAYQKTDTYGFILYLSIKETTNYDGLSSVTVNPLKYSETLIKNFIERNNLFISFEIPSGTTKIGDYAFAYCYALKLNSLPSTVTSIGNYAFYDCYALSLTSLPDGVTSIGNYAFYYCQHNLALTSLPGGVTSIGENAFAYCFNLALTSLPSGITVIKSRAFYLCTSLALTGLPDGIISIESYAFQRCLGLSFSVLPSSLTSIGASAFYECSGITTISCEGAITIFSSGAFNGSSSNPMTLTSASFPNMALTSNISYVFGNSTAANACQLLEFCDIGSTTGIAANAFANCYALETLVLRKSTVCTLANVSAFLNTPMRGYNSKTGTVYVPSDLISSYQTATNWSTLYNDGTVTFIAIEGSDYELD